MHQVVKNNIKQMTSNDQCEQKDVSNLISATRSPSKSWDESRFFGKEAVLPPKFGTRGLVMLGSE